MNQKTQDILPQLREMSTDQLLILVDQLSKNIFDYDSQYKVSKNKPHLRRYFKKNRARALTIIREKQLAAQE